MSRPKRDTNEISAYDRIVSAFWEMLSEMPYAKITISGLSKRAGVNHNLIYYYFENMDDLAIKIFRENMSKGEPQELLSALLQGKLDTQLVLGDPARRERIRRLQLFMRDDSSYLNGIVREAIFSEWIKSTGKVRENLSDDETIDLNFIISGMIGILGSSEHQIDLTTFSKVSERPLGKGITATLIDLQKSQKSGA